jgi:hypothetical protein
MKELTTSEIIEIFQKNHYYIWQDMVKCEHGYVGKFPNPHHLEGSIWAHTMMVMKEADKLSTIFKLAALCHDLGKPYVYEDLDNGKRRFACHEAVSVFYAREVLRSFDLDILETQRILDLVSQHGVLRNWQDKDGRIPEKYHSRIANMFTLDSFQDLAIFMECDANGRFFKL